jgi:hypothetical protein
MRHNSSYVPINAVSQLPTTQAVQEKWAAQSYEERNSFSSEEAEMSMQFSAACNSSLELKWHPPAARTDIVWSVAA